MRRPHLTSFGPPTATNYLLTGLLSGDLIQPPLLPAYNPTRDCNSQTDGATYAAPMSEATYLACYWLFKMTPAAFALTPKGSGTLPGAQPGRLVATLLW